MKVIVLSDTHMPSRARTLPAPLLADLEGCDLILHAGDLATTDVLNLLRGYGPVEAVCGNVDEPELRRILPRRLLVEVQGRRLGMVHGDGSTGSTVGRAQAAFRDDPVDLIVFGHSHQPFHLYDGAVLLFNPGSPTDRRLAPRFSYGRVALGADGRLAAEHVWL